MFSSARKPGRFLGRSKPLRFVWWKKQKFCFFPSLSIWPSPRDRQGAPRRRAAIWRKNGGKTSLPAPRGEPPNKAVAQTQILIRCCQNIHTGQRSSLVSDPRKNGDYKYHLALLGVAGCSDPYRSAFRATLRSRIIQSHCFLPFGHDAPLCLKSIRTCPVKSPPGTCRYLVEGRGSYAGPLVVHGVFAVLQTQGSLFEVQRSLLRRVHQSARYGDTCSPKDRATERVNSK